MKANVTVYGLNLIYPNLFFFFWQIIFYSFPTILLENSNPTFHTKAIRSFICFVVLVGPLLYNTFTLSKKIEDTSVIPKNGSFRENIAFYIEKFNPPLFAFTLGNISWILVILLEQIRNYAQTGSFNYLRNIVGFVVCTIIWMKLLTTKFVVVSKIPENNKATETVNDT